MDWIATGFALFGAFASGGGAWFAWKCWQGAITCEFRLRSERGRIGALESEVENVKAQHMRLHGKFHATLNAGPKEPEPAVPQDRNELRRQFLPGAKRGEH